MGDRIRCAIVVGGGEGHVERSLCPVGVLRVGHVRCAAVAEAPAPAGHLSIRVGAGVVEAAVEFGALLGERRHRRSVERRLGITHRANLHDLGNRRHAAPVQQEEHVVPWRRQVGVVRGRDAEPARDPAE